ncbi:hypothetical protein, partial [Pseudomonas sp. NDM]|uniref:hypothetical protein n=1 Tax=Pseudomonas sp. NDM TaxID=2170733 RepID=UPI001C48D8D7
VWQSASIPLTASYREQAHSYMGYAVWLGPVHSVERGFCVLRKTLLDNPRHNARRDDNFRTDGE